MSEFRSKGASGNVAEPAIRKTPGVCGGDACIRNTRIMVWLLVSMKRQSVTEQELLYNYPSLTPADLAAAWDYVQQNPLEIEAAIQEASNDQED